MSLPDIAELCIRCELAVPGLCKTLLDRSDGFFIERIRPAPGFSIVQSNISAASSWS